MEIPAKSSLRKADLHFKDLRFEGLQFVGTQSRLFGSLGNSTSCQVESQECPLEGNILCRVTIRYVEKVGSKLREVTSELG